MDCFLNYVGLPGCIAENALPIPASGVYLTDLPSITIEMLDKLGNDEKQTFLQVWETVQKRACLRFETTILQALNKHRKQMVKQSLFSGKFGLVPDSFTNEAPLAGLKGVVINIDTDSSELLAIQTPVVSIYSTGVVTTDLFVYDLFDGSVLFTQSIDLVAGWNNIRVEKDFFAKKMLIAYDATNVTTTKVSPQFQTRDRVACSVDLCNCLFDNIQGVTAPLGNPTAYSNANSTGGMQMRISIKCALQSLVCNQRNMFLNAWLYLLGVELMAERIHSSRINFFTTIGLQQAERLRVEFEGIFQDELKTATDAIYIDSCDECFECVGTRIHYSTP